jgi:putative ABC transport system permease protein
LRKVLAVSEVALAVVLLIGAGLLIRTFARLRGVDPGFRSRNVLTLKLNSAWVWGRDPAQRLTFYRRILQGVTAVPGVISAGFTTGVPLEFKGFHVEVTVEGMEGAATVNYRVVTPDYLRTMGIPLRRGRDLDEGDTAEAPRVGLVNETFARHFWPGQDPLGRRFCRGHDVWTTIVGVVGDVKQAGLDLPTQPEFYLPYQQERHTPPGLAIRTAGDPTGVLPAIRRAIWAVDREQPVTDVRTVDQVLEREVFERKLQMGILGSLAGCALVLASIGIYGVLSYLVTFRTHEIGVRMALGARSCDILGDVVGEGSWLVACGLVTGLAGSAASTRLMSHLLFGVTATDPATFTVVPLVCLAAGLLASYLPGRRATKLDVVSVLRND